jgi:hypothetical protein
MMILCSHSFERPASISFEYLYDIIKVTNEHLVFVIGVENT